MATYTVKTDNNPDIFVSERFDVAKEVAEHHYIKTGEHCRVIKSETVWVTTTLADLLEGKAS
jgi:hypothetical protein